MRLWAIQKFLIGVLIFLFLLLGGYVWLTCHLVKQRGGFEQVMIDIGFKSIKEEIAK